MIARAVPIRTLEVAFQGSANVHEQRIDAIHSIRAGALRLQVILRNAFRLPAPGVCRGHLLVVGREDAKLTAPLSAPAIEHIEAALAGAVEHYKRLARSPIDDNGRLTARVMAGARFSGVLLPIAEPLFERGSPDVQPLALAQSGALTVGRAHPLVGAFVLAAHGLDFIFRHANRRRENVARTARRRSSGCVALISILFIATPTPASARGRAGTLGPRSRTTADPYDARDDAESAGRGIALGHAHRRTDRQARRGSAWRSVRDRRCRTACGASGWRRGQRRLAGARPGRRPIARGCARRLRAMRGRHANRRASTRTADRARRSAAHEQVLSRTGRRSE